MEEKGGEETYGMVAPVLRVTFLPRDMMNAWAVNEVVR